MKLGLFTFDSQDGKLYYLVPNKNTLSGFRWKFEVARDDTGDGEIFVECIPA